MSSSRLPGRSEAKAFSNRGSATAIARRIAAISSKVLIIRRVVKRGAADTGFHPLRAPIRRSTSSKAVEGSIARTPLEAGRSDAAMRNGSSVSSQV